MSSSHLPPPQYPPVDPPITPLSQTVNLTNPPPVHPVKGNNTGVGFQSGYPPPDHSQFTVNNIGVGFQSGYLPPPPDHSQFTANNAPHPQLYTTPSQDPFPSRDIRYYGEQTMSHPPPQDNVQYHPVTQGQSYGRGRNTPGQGYPNQDQWAPQNHLQWDHRSPCQLPPPHPSQGGRSDHLADPYQDDPSDYPDPYGDQPYHFYPHYHHQPQPHPFQTSDPKLSKYNGKVPWRAYEVKLDHMAHKYNWVNATKLAKLVEALEDKALTFYSILPGLTWESYPLVKAKFNVQFGPKEPSRTACNQLAILQQNSEEELEEFAEQALCISMDAWGDLSTNMANAAAKEAFIHGVSDKETAFITMSQNPDTLDDALAFLKQVIYDKKSLAGQGKPVTKVAWNVSFSDIPESIEPVIHAAVPTPTPQVTNPAVTKLQESMSKMLAMLKKTAASTPPRANNSWFCGPWSNSGPPSPMICHKCKGVGHGYWECPSQRDATSSGTPSQSPSKLTTPSLKPLNGQGLN